METEYKISYGEKLELERLQEEEKNQWKKSKKDFKKSMVGSWILLGYVVGLACGGIATWECRIKGR